jgi:hypothetical protein
MSAWGWLAIVVSLVAGWIGLTTLIAWLIGPYSEKPPKPWPPRK